MLTEVVKKNNDNFISLEDTYIMSPSSGYPGNPSEPMEVIIKCPHKRKKVCALTTGGISISATANWKSIFDSGVASVLKQGMNSISGTLSWMQGQSVMQPWMNRKVWESTQPFTVTIPISFVSTLGDAKSEVYDPIMALLSFCYPRQYGLGENGTTGKYHPDQSVSALTTFQKLVSKVSTGMDKIGLSAIGSYINEFKATDDTTAIGAMLNSFKLYNIPGPALNTQDKELGDPVSIMIGPAFNLGVVYLKDVKIDSSKTLDPSGYPLAAKVTLTAEPANACYCKPDGNLVIFDQWEEGTEDINNMINRFGEAVESTTEGAQQLIQGFIGTFQNITALF